MDRKWCEPGEAGCGSGRGGSRISRRGVTLRGRRHYARPTARHRRPPAPLSPRKNDASSAPLLRLHKFTRPEYSAYAQCVSASTNKFFSHADACFNPDLGILRGLPGDGQTPLVLNNSKLVALLHKMTQCVFKIFCFKKWLAINNATCGDANNEPMCSGYT